MTPSGREATPPAWPVGPFSTIVADPPWGYEGRTPPWRSSSAPTYSLMTLGQIKSLPVASIAHEDAHLYLWAVLPMMAEAFDVVRAWGFTPDTMLTWCKPGPGLGAGFRGNTEHLIVARRGASSINPTCRRCTGRVRGANKCGCDNPDWRYMGEPVDPMNHRFNRRPYSRTAAGTWYEAPRGEHSVKPDLFLDLVEAMSVGPYVELFARRKRPGWVTWGDEAPSGEVAA